MQNLLNGDTSEIVLFCKYVYGTTVSVFLTTYFVLAAIRDKNAVFQSWHGWLSGIHPRLSLNFSFIIIDTSAASSELRKLKKNKADFLFQLSCWLGSMVTKAN